jgi:hypothetical protein
VRSWSDSKHCREPWHILLFKIFHPVWLSWSYLKDSYEAQFYIFCCIAHFWILRCATIQCSGSQISFCVFSVQNPKKRKVIEQSDESGEAEEELPSSSPVKKQKTAAPVAPAKAAVAAAPPAVKIVKTPQPKKKSPPAKAVEPEPEEEEEDDGGDQSGEVDVPPPAKPAPAKQPASPKKLAKKPVAPPPKATPPPAESDESEEEEEPPKPVKKAAAAPAAKKDVPKPKPTPKIAPKPDSEDEEEDDDVAASPPKKAAARPALKAAKSGSAASTAPPSPKKPAAAPAPAPVKAAAQKAPFIPHVAHSGLNDSEVDILYSFPDAAKKNKSALGMFRDEEVVPGTTHLVLGSKPQRTLKVLKAISIGIWVVSFDWVLECMEAGKWLPCHQFETTRFPGAKKSRGAHHNKDANVELIFKGKKIMITGSVAPPKEELIDMVKNLGGSIANSGAAADYIVSTAQAVATVKEPKGPIVSVEWLLDAISDYKIPDATKYKPSAEQKKAPQAAATKAAAAPKKTSAAKKAAPAKKKKKVLEDSDESSDGGYDDDDE